MTSIMSVIQAADKVGVTPETIRRYIRDGILPAKRLPGGGLRINSEALDAVLKPVMKD